MTLDKSLYLQSLDFLSYKMGMSIVPFSQAYLEPLAGHLADAREMLIPHTFLYGP